MIHFILVHLLTLVFLSHFEMGIFIVSSPVRSLDFSNPFISSWFMSWSTNFILSWFHPEIQVWHIVWFKSPVHLVNSIPRNKSTRSKTLSSINFQDMSRNFGRTISLEFEIYCSEVRKITALATSSTVAILYNGILDEALFLKFWYSFSVIPVYL